MSNNNYETTHDHHETKKSVFTIEEARAFVEQNVYKMTGGTTPLQAKDLECVDGRVKDADKFRVPGGALGIEFAVFCQISISRCLEWCGCLSIVLICQ